MISSYRIVETISCALLNQEKRNRYVSKQVALMLRLQEETMHSQLQYSLQQQITTSNGNHNNVTNDNVKKNISATSGNTSNDNSSIGKKKLSAPLLSHLEGSSNVNPTLTLKNTSIDNSNDSISNIFAAQSNGNGNSTGNALASPQRRASFISPSSPLNDSTIPATTSIIPAPTIDREVISNAYSASMNNNAAAIITISPGIYISNLI